MITIEINETRQSLADINPSWINEQVRKRQANGISVCLRIYIKQGNVDLVFSCGECSEGAGGRRPVNQDEKRIIALWEKLDCKDKQINTGKITAFLRKIQ